MEEKKSKNEAVFENFIKWARGVFMIFTPIAILSASFMFGQYYKESKLLMFETPGQRDEFITKVKKLPTTIQLDNFDDYIDDAVKRINGSNMDSLYVTKKEFLQLIGNNSIDIYNMKRNMDKILDGQNENKAMLKAIGIKIDKIDKK